MKLGIFQIRKVLLTVVFDSGGVISHEYLSQASTVGTGLAYVIQAQKPIK